MSDPTPAYRPQAEDTSADVDRRLMDAYRQMSPWEKARRVEEDSLAVEELALIGIRLRHPGASDRDQRHHLAALRFDRETLRLAFGWEPGAKDARR
jgi:hypothetical protein